jgi:hypothetical protein
LDASHRPAAGLRGEAGDQNTVSVFAYVEICESILANMSDRSDMGLVSALMFIGLPPSEQDL